MEKINRIILNFFRIGILPTFLLSGCYEIEKLWHDGTVKGVSLCIEHYTDMSDLLSESYIRSKCIKEHSKILPNQNSKLQARIEVKNDFVKVALIGGNNEFDKFVITGINLLVVLWDKNGKPHSDTGYLDSWIEPSKPLEGSLQINFKFPDEEYIGSCKKISDQKSCINFEVLNLIGVETSL